MKTEHILVIRFSAMGDVAMTVPVVHALATTYPNVRITVLSRDFARPFFEHLPDNVGFMEADVKSEYHGIRGLNKLYRRLAAKHFTAVADLHGVLRTEYLRMLFVMAHVRVAHIDKHRDGKHRLCSQKHKQLVQQPTSFENYADVFARLGYPVRPTFTSIFPQGGVDLSLLPPSIGLKPAGQAWIGVSPFAAHQGKVYPPGQMKEVLALLRRQHPDSRLLVFGAFGADADIVAEWQRDVEGVENVSQMLGGLRQELILISHLDVMLSMDSANMHLASLCHVPVVSVWGATHPYAGFLGWGQQMDDVVQRDMPCRPCSVYGNRPCQRGDWACMTGIRPEEICRKVSKRIGK